MSITDWLFGIEPRPDRHDRHPMGRRWSQVEENIAAFKKDPLFYQKRAARANNRIFAWTMGMSIFIIVGDILFS